MKDLIPMRATKRWWDDLKKMVEEYRQRKKPTAGQEKLLNGLRPPVRFITHVPYSTYTLKTYAADSYDLDGDNRAGQKYVVMVDGETPVAVSLLQYDPNGNHKQMVSFDGDSVSGTIKLILEGESTTDISLASGTLTEAYLTQKLEALSNIGTGNVKVSIWPGRWLIEFARGLAGFSFDLFEVDRISSAVFEVHVYETVWKDSGVDAEVLYPIPLIGEWDGDDDVINDAVAAGSIGTAQWFPNVGWVADVNECRSYNGDGTPDL